MRKGMFVNVFVGIIFGTFSLTLLTAVPTFTMASVDVHISIPPPPPIVFAGPPEVVVIPDTYVYVVPGIDVDLFFWDGWWWRLWEGRWYRSHYYDRGWAYYNHVPSFYFDVDPGWRAYYRSHNWYGHRWNYERIPYSRLQQNWKSWQNNRYWEKRGTWGVQSYQPRPVQQRQELRLQREQQYQQRQGVQQHQEQTRQQQRQSEVQNPRRQEQRDSQAKQPKQPQHQSQVQQPQQQQQRQQPLQSQGRQHRGESQHPQFQEKPQGGNAEHRK